MSKCKFKSSYFNGSVKIVSTFLLILSISLFFGINRSSAATGLTIQPIKVSQTIDPGSSTSGYINLSNASDGDVVVELKVEDFVPSAGSSGINFVGRAPGVTSVRDWITTDAPAEFVFKKGETKSIKYSIDVPKGAEPGSHFGVIFFKAIDKANADQQLKIGTQVGVLVFVTVTGDFKQSGNILSIKAPSFVKSGPVPFDIKFENTGTVHFEPKGKIVIRNLFGKEVGNVPVEGQVVLPTGVKDLSFAWAPSGMIIGRYIADIEILDIKGAVIAKETKTIYAAPLWYIGFFLLALFILWNILKFLKSKVSISIRQP